MREIDVLVVGAGPAGSCAARTAALAGARVLILELGRQVGVPVQCAEYVPARLRDVLGEAWNEQVVEQKVDIMRTFLPDGSVCETPAPGMLINRAVFDQHLATLAICAGADLRTETRVVEVKEGRVIARQRRSSELLEVKPKVIIGADGPRSTVARAMAGQIADNGVSKALYARSLVAIQCRVRLPCPLASTEVYFDPLYVGGYGWRFPKGEVANVGVGLYLEAGISPKAALSHLMARLGMTRRDILGYGGGTIPCCGPLPRTRINNVLLVGDAAGQTHPITGAGIAAACLCGQMAGRAAARAALSDNLLYLDEYEREWRAWLEGPLTRAAARRREMDAGWSNDPPALAELLRRTWIAFPEYGRRKTKGSRRNAAETNAWETTISDFNAR